MATTHQRQTKKFPLAVRPLTATDVYQSAEIEREAFPTLFPPTSFSHELKNRLASYLVAWTRSKALRAGPGGGPAPAATNGDRDLPSLTRLLRDARSRWNGIGVENPEGRDYVAGFLGTWYMAGEAHIVSVGVRTEDRGRGVGEILLIAGIEQAIDRGAEVVTLEVRPSNMAARNLYTKYDFTEQGVRKSYYSDNREDALIMTTSPIQGVAFHSFFLGLAQEHERRWGHAERVIS